MLAGSVRTLETRNGTPGQHRENISIRLGRGLGIGSAGLWGRGIVWPLRAAGQSVTTRLTKARLWGFGMACRWGWDLTGDIRPSCDRRTIRTHPLRPRSELNPSELWDAKDGAPTPLLLVRQGAPAVSCSFRRRSFWDWRHSNYLPWAALE